jgi:SAM-dependent methyltransferase
MMNIDLQFFDQCYDLGIVRDPFLEIGSAKVQSNVPSLTDVVKAHGMKKVCGADAATGPGVDVAFDFELDPVEFRERWEWGTFQTVAVFNVLEHTFRPFNVLRNALQCTEPGGYLIGVTPAVWPLHDFPRDFVRLMPHWYERAVIECGAELVRQQFCWLTDFGIIPVDTLQRNGQLCHPSWIYVVSRTNPRYWVTRICHRVFNTYGRNHQFTHAAIAVVIRKGATV